MDLQHGLLLALQARELMSAPAWSPRLIFTPVRLTVLNENGRLLQLH